jgi:2'-5' RNA ligase
MNTNILQMPGYRLNEYLLVLQPHEELRGRIHKIKQDFGDRYKAASALITKPHITLLRFMQLEMMEERILHRFKTAAMGFYPFKVELKDFGSFPSHTIYINVTSREPVTRLVRELKPFQRLLKYDKDHTPHFMTEPHLTIARNLAPWQYEKSWPEYSHKNFTGRFIADGMLLLKRKQGDKHYQALQRFNFENLPVAVRQGDLFAMA